MVEIIAIIIEEVIILKIIEEELKIINNKIIFQINSKNFNFNFNFNFKYNSFNKPYNSLKYNSLNYKSQTNNNKNLLH